MSKIKTIKKLWKHNRQGLIGAIYGKVVRSGLLNSLSDENFLKLSYRAYLGNKLDLDNPKTFNEKLQWLKLHDRNPKYNELVDKQMVKEYIAKEIGEEYVIPTLGVWNSVEEIEFDKLPKQFVLKCTHDSGSTIVCKDKDKFDFEVAKKKLSKKMKKNLFWWGREWPYKDLKPRIIAEEYMEDCATEELRDYKWYCFDGEPNVLMVNTDRSKGKTKADYFDMDYEYLQLNWGYPHATNIPQKPEQFGKMKQIAAILSANIPHVRVDFYVVNNKIYFGELTFFDASGFEKIEPVEWDYTLGSWIKLPLK